MEASANKVAFIIIETTYTIIAYLQTVLEQNNTYIKTTFVKC